jgi:L-ribulose-5-phosphate 3-epimerase UlaE
MIKQINKNVDLMEKSILSGITKLQAMDKIMDKPWKTLSSLPHLTHNFAHNLQQVIPSHNELYHKLHNYDCYS